jgi:prepilin-type N-terminal cleavage/methylation domain-containing protein
MQMANHRARTHRAQAGFTLVELMVIVVIVGILAMLGSYGVRKYIISSKTSEATGMIATIKAAQEQYKEETFQYLDVTGSLDTYYPANPKPGRMKMQWGGGNVDNWHLLGVNAPNPVLFVYSCTAGGAGTKPPATGSDITIGNWPTDPINAPWYVVKAVADFDGDGRNTTFVGASFAGDLYSNGYNL